MATAGMIQVGRIPGSIRVGELHSLTGDTDSCIPRYVAFFDSAGNGDRGAPGPGSGVSHAIWLAVRDHTNC
jgi:hypothetical protein